jgi:hypothetical protein
MGHPEVGLMDEGAAFDEGDGEVDEAWEKYGSLSFARWVRRGRGSE